MSSNQLNEIDTQQWEEHKTFFNGKIDLIKFEELNNRFLLEERVGKSSTSVIWKALDKKLSRTVAIKMLPSNLQNNSELQQRLIRESKILSRLSHSNIIQIYDCLKEDNSENYFLVLEMCQGGDLYEYVYNCKETPPLKWLLQIIETIEYLHSHNIIHRDIKLSNVLLDRSLENELEDINIKIADFGITKGGEQTLTRKNKIMGTAIYMPPESLGGKWSINMDIYSYGILMYEFLTKNLPYKGYNLKDLLEIKQSPLYLDIDHLPKTQIKSLREIIYNCTQPDVKDRPQAEEIIVALRKSI